MPPAFNGRNCYSLRRRPLITRNSQVGDRLEDTHAPHDCFFLRTEVFVSITLIGVGIDTARYGHHVSFLGVDKRKALPGFHFKESSEGYALLASSFDKLATKFPDAQFSIRLDAAGQYAANLIRFLEALPHKASISVGQPKQNKDYKSVHFPKQKSDPVDSLACARFAIVEQPVPTPSVPLAFSQLREVLSALQSQTKRTTRLINQLHNRLSRTFPELAVLCPDLSAGYVLALLIKYPTAQKVAAASASSLSKISYLRDEKASEILAAAKQSTASIYGPSAELIVSQLANEIIASQAFETNLESMLTKVFDALPGGNHKKILTIPGVGKLTAASIVATVVSLDRFASPDSLVNFFGVFPERESSGTDKHGKPLPPGPAHMSRKGNDLVRKMLYMSALTAIGVNPLLRSYYAKHRSNGKDGGTALGHCMRKLLHWIYAIWTTGKDFDVNHGKEQIAVAAPQDSQPEFPSQELEEPNECDAPSKEKSLIAAKQKKSVGRKELGSKRQAVTTDDTILSSQSESVKRPKRSVVQAKELVQSSSPSGG